MALVIIDISLQIDDILSKRCRHIGMAKLDHIILLLLSVEIT